MWGEWRTTYAYVFSIDWATVTSGAEQCLYLFSTSALPDLACYPIVAKLCMKLNCPEMLSLSFNRKVTMIVSDSTESLLRKIPR